MTEVTEKKHALLSPSGYDRWGKCPGSVALEAPFPNVGSKYARWGTAAHEIAERCLVQKCDAETFIDETIVVEGQEFIVDMAMADCVNEFVSYVHHYLDVSMGDIIMPEQQVPLAHMTGETDATGTSDVIGIADKGETLVVIDLKTGSGVQVFADSGQLRMYASGALAKFGAIYDIKRIRCVIVQPPLHHVDELEITVDELREFEEQVAIAAGRTQIGNAELVPGDKQCRFCRAKAVCPALRDEVLSTVTVSDGSAFRNLDEKGTTLPKQLAATISPHDLLSNDQLAQQYRALRLVEEWVSATRAECERRVFAGEAEGLGLKIVQGKAGNRQWRDETEALKLMKKAPTLKIDDVAPRKIVSPTAAEKLFKGDDKRWAKIAPLITQAEGKPSVVPLDDPRPEYQVVSTAESFAALPAAETALTAPADQGNVDLSALLS